MTPTVSNVHPTALRVSLRKRSAIKSPIPTPAIPRVAATSASSGTERVTSFMGGFRRISHKFHIMTSAKFVRPKGALESGDNSHDRATIFDPKRTFRLRAYVLRLRPVAARALLAHQYVRQ